MSKGQRCGQLACYAFLVTLLLGVSLAHAESGDLFSLTDTNPAKLGTKITQEENAIRVDTLWPTTINLAEVQLQDKTIQDTTLKYSAQMKAQNLEGTAFLEMWAHFPGPKGGSYFSRGLDNQLTKESDWKAFGTPFFLKKDQVPNKVTLNLVINGKGTVWIKDVKLQR